MVQVTKTKKSSKANAKPAPEQVLDAREQALVDLVKDCFHDGNEYKNKFKDRWTTIEAQIRCQHPDDWSEKEDWQSKVFIPQQAKTSETAYSYLDKILFGQPKFFDIAGVDNRDKEQEGALYDLIQGSMQGSQYDRGNFYFENEFILREATDIGTAFLKVLVHPQRKGLIYNWRSPFYLVFDPSCGHNFYQAKWIIDTYRRSLQSIIESANDPFPLYKKDRIQKMLEMMASEVSEVRSSEGDKAIAEIKGFDGTNILIPKKYLGLDLREYWGPVKVAIEKQDDKDMSQKTLKDFEYQERIVTTINDKFILRDDQNDYGFKPFFIARTKLRKYDTYGLGFCENSIDLQDLMNSMVNLGFDSLKICSMDIAMINENEVKDKSSIEYKPKALWRFKSNPREAVQLSRQGISALGDIIRGLTVLDQFQQEASGVLRQIQGAESGGSTTLGEYNAKLAMADNRFLKVARMMEKDYIIPLVRGVFKILFNKKFFNQELINRMIGTRTVTTTIAGLDGTPQTTTLEIPKLDFEKVAELGDMSFDFKATGMTQFVSRLETLEKLKEMLITTVKIPQLMIITKIDELYKRVLQAAEIQDYQDLVKTDSEIKQIYNQIYGGAGTMPGQAPSGTPGLATPQNPNPVPGEPMPAQPILTQPVPTMGVA